MLGRLPVVLVLALLAVAVAPLALTGGPAGGLVAAQGPTGDTLPWNTLDCHFVYATVEVSTARLARYMPPGFIPYELHPVTGRNPVAGLAFEADDCAEGSGLAGQVAPMEYASTWVQAFPPHGKDVPGVFLVVAWDLLVPDDARRDHLLARGAGVRDGSVHFGAELGNGMPLTPFAVDYTLEGLGAYRIDVAPLRELSPPGGGEFAQYTPGAGGSLSFWRTHWQAERSYQGAGVVTVPAGSWQADVIGATSAPARVNFGTWDYFDGTIVLSG